MPTPSNPLSHTHRFLARSLSGLLPKLEVQPLDIRQLCSNQAVGKQYQRDPLNYHGAIRVRVGYEIMQAQAAMRAGAAAGECCTLISDADVRMVTRAAMAMMRVMMLMN